MIISSYRGPREPIPEEETTVWACTSETCNGWMREAFTFDEKPTCPLCEGNMEQETRMIPVIR